MKIERDDFRGIYAEMSKILGEEIVKIIYKYNKGQQINLQMRLYSNEYVEKYIVNNYGKSSVREMVRELGYSDKWVSRLIKNVIFKEENTV